MNFASAERLVQQLARALAVLGGLGLLAAIAVTCVSILGKLCNRLLNAVFGADAAPAWLAWAKPILGEEELVQYAVGLALFASLPWLTLQQGHITINLLQNKFSRAVNRLLDLLGNLIFCAVIYMMMTQQWFLIFKKARAGEPALAELLLRADFAGTAARLRTHDESQILGLKLLPLYTAAEVCVIFLFAVSVFCVLRSARALRRKEGAE